MLERKNRICPKTGLLAAILLLWLATISGASEESLALLRPPGLRLVKDPSIVIPALYQYPNRSLELPAYRSAFGKMKKGWARQFVKTRRFSSNHSAWIHYRTSDLSRSKFIKASEKSTPMRIWPIGTIIILESYQGNNRLINNPKPLEIFAMIKKGNIDNFHAKPYYPVNWNYARYTPEGKPFITPKLLKECHQCHSIAFHLSGDLIFTQVP
ncbi:MAG: cytochrome P460 family protein [Planctomycetota bacterium]|jgi:hypothetical protein